MASIANTAFLSSILSLSQYSSSGEMQVHQKDGQQFLMITVIALQRLNLLASQLAPLLPELVAIPFTPITLGLVILPFLLPQNNCFDYLKHIQPILNKSDEIINAACLVSYVSLIALGFPLQGAIGLAGLALIMLKQTNWIPPSIDSLLRPLSGGALIASGFLSNSYLLGGLMILGGSIVSIPFLAQKLGLEKRWPQLAHPFHGMHDKKNEIKLSPPQKDETIEDWLNKLSFSINPSYIYSDHVEKLLPDDCHESDYKKLFDLLEEKIRQRKIPFSPKEKEGFDQLKTQVIRGVSSETDLRNVKSHHKMLTSIASSLVREEVDFENKLRAFALLGISCEMGRDRETNLLFNPRSKDPEWAVHHNLAIARGDSIEEAIVKIMNKTKKGSWGGGPNNAHTTSGAHMLMYATYRSYQAESCRQKFYSIFSNLLFRYLHTDLITYPMDVQNFFQKDLKGKFSEFLKIAWNLEILIFFAMHRLALFLDVSPGFTPQDCKSFEKRLKKDPLFSDPNQIIERVYQAIKPNAHETDDKKIIVSRQIVWETIKEQWFPSFQEKHPDIDLSTHWDSLIEHTPLGGTLSKTGVKLMLWDMGILKKN